MAPARLLELEPFEGADRGLGEVGNHFERDVAPLVEAVGALLEPCSFAILTAYAVGFSPLGLRNLLAGIPGGALEWGELVLPEAEPEGEGTGGEGFGPRLLPAGFCARWTTGLARR